MKKLTAMLGIVLFFVSFSVSMAQKPQDNSIIDKQKPSSKSNSNRPEDAVNIQMNNIRKKIEKHELNSKFHWGSRVSGNQLDDVIELGKTGDPRVNDILENIALTYSSVVARQNALTSLEILSKKNKASLTSIKKALKDPNILVRRKAASILSKIEKDGTTISVLLDIVKTKHLDELDKDILEDEFYNSEYYILYLYQHGRAEEANRLNPNLKTLSLEYIENWKNEYLTFRENIIIFSMQELAAIWDNKINLKEVLKDISKTGPTEHIRVSAKEISNNIK